MKLRIKNNDELGAWMNSRKDSTLHAIKGNAPEGATYDDGDLITNPVNVGWIEPVSGDKINIDYYTQEECLYE